MAKLNTYRIVEFDANDVPHVLRAGLTRADARERLARLRAAYAEYSLRYIMKRDEPEPERDPRVEHSLWTGNIAGE